MRSAAAGEHRTGEDTAKRTLGRARRRATVAKRDGGLRGLATACPRERAKTPRGERPSCGRRPHHFRGECPKGPKALFGSRASGHIANHAAWRH